MKTHGKTERIRWKYTRAVPIPADYRPYLWDYPGEKAPLEVILKRVLTYGGFEDLKWLMSEYPNETLDLVERYSSAPFCREGRMRGVRVWVRELSK